MSDLSRRLRRLEEGIGRPAGVVAVALDVPNGGDMVLTAGGEWSQCPDGRALLADLGGKPVKVYAAFDVREA